MLPSFASLVTVLVVAVEQRMRMEKGCWKIPYQLDFKRPFNNGFNTGETPCLAESNYLVTIYFKITEFTCSLSEMSPLWMSKKRSVVTLVDFY